MKNKAINIINKLKSNGYEAYFVGGCVRDELLGYEVKDYDITTNATPEEIKSIFGNTVTCGNTFLVSIVDNIEVATYRTDFSDKAVKANSVEEDIIRRDFTINGLIMDSQRNVLDIVGAKDDIINRVLRFIGEPVSRINEDPVRIIRGLRFMAKYNLKAEYNTHFAIYQMRHLIDNIPKERIQKEIVKAFSNSGAYEFVKLLDEYELLEKIFPSVYKLKGLKGGKHHNETVYTHCLNALKALDDNKHSYQLKLACLYHDTGKFDAQKVTDLGISFFNHNQYSTVHAKEDLLNLKFCNKDIEYVSNLCDIHMFHILERDNITVNKKRVKKLMVHLTNLNISLKDFVLIRYADNHSNMLVVRPFRSIKNQYKQMLHIVNEKAPFSVKDLAVNGYDLIKLGIPQSRVMRCTLELLLDKVINEYLPNDKQVLLDYLKKNIEESKKYTLKDL